MKSNSLFLCLLVTVFQVNAGALKVPLYACGKTLVKHCFAATAMPHRSLSTYPVLRWNHGGYRKTLETLIREQEENACYAILGRLAVEGDYRRDGLTRMVFDTDLSFEQKTKQKLMEAVKKAGILKKVCVGLDKDADVLDMSSVPSMAIMRLPFKSPLILMNKTAQDLLNQTNLSSRYDHEHAVSMFFHELGHLVKDNFFLMGLTEAFCPTVIARAIARNSEYQADAYVASLGGVASAKKMQEILKLDRYDNDDPFSTHPSSTDRVKRLEEIIKRMEAK